MTKLIGRLLCFIGVHTYYVDWKYRMITEFYFSKYYERAPMYERGVLTCWRCGR